MQGLGVVLLSASSRSEPSPRPYAVFEGPRLLARGSVVEAALACKRAEADGRQLFVFGPEGRLIDIDTRGDEEAVRARYSPPPAEPRGRGRPKLGVVAREVTLLPRHWEWLATQPGGASVALRKLVDQARKADDAPQRQRAARDAAYRFMSAMAGNFPGFEEAIRALYAGDRPRLLALTEAWPADVRDHALSLADAP